MPVIDFKNMDKLFILLYRQKMKANEFENKVVIMENFNPSLELASPKVIAEVFMEFLKTNRIDSAGIEINRYTT